MTNAMETYPVPQMTKFRSGPHIVGTSRDPRGEAQARAIASIANREITIRWYTEAIARAFDAFGDGDGSLISGVVRDHFPEATKAELRGFCQTMNRFHDEAIEHWRKSGRTRAKFRAIASVVAEDYRAANPLRHHCYYY